MATESHRAIRLGNGRISVDAEATFQNLLDAIETAPASELGRCWTASKGAHLLFPHRPASPPQANRLGLDRGIPPPQYELPTIRPRAVWEFACDLRDLGFAVESTHLVTDTIDSYIDRCRDIDVLTIAEPIGMTAVAYPGWAHRILGLSTEPPEPGSCRIVATFTVPVGHYLCCSTGSWGSHALHHVRRIKTVPERDQITAVPGVGAEVIRSECRTCGGRWAASGGSQQFKPEPGPAKRTWDFAKAGKNGSSIGCPNRSCSGTLTFTN